MKPRKKISNKLNFLLKAFSEHSMFSVAMLFFFFFFFLILFLFGHAT